MYTVPVAQCILSLIQAAYTQTSLKDHPERLTTALYQADYSKASLNRPTRGPTFSGPFWEIAGLGSWDICMGDRLGLK